ncbi:lipocalin family protein [Flavobacterium luminosum]|uniref:Lipocalin family protein n=1 Tax=Flavobacterium luminosum TaxID=2949086 RepID=A0ABT0TNW7_9FLAO|nr:lipocalin family protein [Flavobacterium sp. HXWNR70]MCL9808739.1 lipocalin family protein [Flavobacterium sp. HXWNR70]
MKIKTLLLLFLMVTLMTGFYSCSTIPNGAVAVQSFDKERYLGKWYEMARLDFKYERDLSNTTAFYSLNEDGTIKVDNKGYHTKKETWTQAIGKAKFVGAEHVGMLKVSFFGPFYSGYNVIAIDENYQYALVAGKNLKYLWILSRKPHLPEAIKEHYLKIADSIGFTTADLLWVKHDQRK